MSKVVQFNFEKSNDKEIEINGELYKIPMDDDSKDKYIIATRNFGKVAQDVSDGSQDLLAMSDEEIKALTEKQRDAMSELIDTILGAGMFSTMYKLAGKSVINLMPLAQELLKLVSAVDDDQLKAIQKQYLQNGKK